MNFFSFPSFIDMPFIEDWITHPMTIINRLYGKSSCLFYNMKYIIIWLIQKNHQVHSRMTFEIIFKHILIIQISIKKFHHWMIEMMNVHYHRVVLYVIEGWYKIWLMMKFIVVSFLNWFNVFFLKRSSLILAHYKVRSNDHHQTEIEKSAKYMDLFVCPVSNRFSWLIIW